MKATVGESKENKAWRGSPASYWCPPPESQGTKINDTRIWLWLCGLSEWWIDSADRKISKYVFQSVVVEKMQMGDKLKEEKLRNEQNPITATRSLAAVVRGFGLSCSAVPPSKHRMREYLIGKKCYIPPVVSETLRNNAKVHWSC